MADAVCEDPTFTYCLGCAIVTDSNQTDLKRGALVTFAFLKAQLDDGDDHLGLFMPLLLDAMHVIVAPHFSLEDVQQSLEHVHAISMPQQAVDMLLRRAEKKQYITAQYGRYKRGDKFPQDTGITEQRAAIKRAQDRLANALVEYFTSRKLTITLPDAISALLAFLERTHIAVLTNDSERLLSETKSLSQVDLVIAEFIYAVAQKKTDFRETIRSITEGFVLYFAALRPTFNDDTSRSLRRLKVFFDSTLILQLLGLEGASAESLMRDTLSVLVREGVTCSIFDVTVKELHGIVRRYVSSWRTDYGRRNMRMSDMKRHLLLSKASGSDLEETDVLLETKIKNLGISIVPTPTRVPKYNRKT